MSEQSQIGWAEESITYHPKLVEEIKELLVCNNNDIVKVFTLLWDERKLPLNSAPMSLMLIERVANGTLK